MAAHEYVRAAGLLQQLQQIARHRMAYAELAYPTSAANEGRRTPAVTPKAAGATRRLLSLG
jgi:hypothetical protein